MALSFANPTETGERGIARGTTASGGLRIAVVDMTASDVSSDYDSGYDIRGAKLKAGFGQILAVLSCSSRSSSDTLATFKGIFNPATGKLRLYNNATEAVADSTINDGDVVRLVLLGA